MFQYRLLTRLTELPELLIGSQEIQDVTGQESEFITASACADIKSGTNLYSSRREWGSTPQVLTRQLISLMDGSKVHIHGDGGCVAI